METFVPGCVGVLAAGCVAGLCELFETGEFGVGCLARVRRMGGDAVRVSRAVRQSARRAAAALERHGVPTPRARRGRARVEREMPEAFSALAISMGSGLSLEQGMRYVGARAEEPVGTEFLRVASLMACGVSASAALDELLGRLRAPGMGLVTLALKVSQRTGAPLADVLGEASRLVGQRIELKRQLDVKTAQVRMSARVVAGMPMAMIAFLALTSPDFRSGVATPAGAGSIALAGAMNFAAWSIIRSVMRVRM